MTPDKNYSKKLTDEQVWMYHRAAICKAIAIGLAFTITAFFVLTGIFYLISLLRNYLSNL